jgi:hypothetical protein
MVLLDSCQEEILWLDGGHASKILGYFGIRECPAEQPLKSNDHGCVRLEVRSDPSFGPLIGILQDGRSPVDRITPLTDRDVCEIIETAGIPSDWGVEELLGRVSQMIEELPWLCVMKAEIHCAESGEGSPGVALGAGVQLGFCRRHELKGREDLPK